MTGDLKKYMEKSKAIFCRRNCKQKKAGCPFSSTYIPSCTVRFMLCFSLVCLVLLRFVEVERRRYSTKLGPHWYIIFSKCTKRLYQQEYYRLERDPSALRRDTPVIRHAKPHYFYRSRATNSPTADKVFWLEQKCRHLWDKGRGDWGGEGGKRPRIHVRVRGKILSCMAGLLSLCDTVLNSTRIHGGGGITPSSVFWVHCSQTKRIVCGWPAGAE